MERILLYYPTIEIPNTSWLYSSLLYSDKVSSIVPYDDINDNRYTDTLKYLIDEQQYEPICVWKFNLSTFHEPYMEFVSLFQNTIETEEFQRLVIRNKGLSNKFFMELYKIKVTTLRQVLEAYDLIEKNSNSKDTVLVEETTALFLMGLMAQYFCKIDKVNLITPSTDDKRYENIAFRLQENRQESINFSINNCLPTPNQDQAIKKIIEFKKKRRDELLQFRKYLSSFQDRLVKAETTEEIKEIQIRAKEDIEKGINDISKLCSDSKIKTFFSSFSSLLNLENPKLFHALTVAGAVTTPINPLAGVVSGLVGISGGLVSSYLNTKREVEKSEFSYLFQAQKNKLLK